jgi:hypothetical protein
MKKYLLSVTLIASSTVMLAQSHAGPTYLDLSKPTEQPITDLNSRLR